MQVLGSFFRVMVDKEGASKVTFEFPQSELAKVLTIAEQTETLLKITVEKE